MNKLYTYITHTHAQDLLYRRTRSLANFESANKKLETAKAKSKGVHDAEANQQTCKEKFDKLSEVGRDGKMTVVWSTIEEDVILITFLCPFLFF